MPFPPHLFQLEWPPAILEALGGLPKEDLLFIGDHARQPLSWPACSWTSHLRGCLSPFCLQSNQEVVPHWSIPRAQQPLEQSDAESVDLSNGAAMSLFNTSENCGLSAKVVEGRIVDMEDGKEFGGYVPQASSQRE